LKQRKKRVEAANRIGIMLAQAHDATTTEEKNAHMQEAQDVVDHNSDVLDQEFLEAALSGMTAQHLENQRWLASQHLKHQLTLDAAHTAAQLEAQKSDVSQVQKNLQDVQAQLQSSIAREQKLQSALTAAQQAVQQETKIKESESRRVERLEAEKTALTEQVKALTKQNEIEISRLREQAKTSLQQAQDEAKTSLQQAQDEAAALRAAQTKKKTKRQTKKRARVTAETTRSKAHEDQVKQLQKSLEDIGDKLRAAQNQAATKDADLVVLKGQVKAQQNEIQAARDMTTTTQQEVKAKETKIQKLVEELKVMTRNVDKAELAQKLATENTQKLETMVKEETEAAERRRKKREEEQAKRKREAAAAKAKLKQQSEQERAAKEAADKKAVQDEKDKMIAEHEAETAALRAELEKQERIAHALKYGDSSTRQQAGGTSDTRQLLNTIGSGLVAGAKSTLRSAANVFASGVNVPVSSAKGGSSGGLPFHGFNFGRGDDDDDHKYEDIEFSDFESLPGGNEASSMNDPPPPPPERKTPPTNTGKPIDHVPTAYPSHWNHPNNPPPPEVIEAVNPGQGPTVAGVLSDAQGVLDSITTAAPALSHAGTYVGTALALGAANRAYNWINPEKQPGPNLKPPPGMRPPGPVPPKAKRQKTVIDADTEETGGGDGSGRGTNQGRKKQDKQPKKFQSQGGYLTVQPWDMPKTQLLQNGSDPEPFKPDPEDPNRKDPMTPGQVWPPVVLPGNVDRATDALRPRYGLVGPRDVIPSPIDQLRSDIAFDMFSFVQPGFGEGSDNKLFKYQQNTENNIQAMGRSFLPRPDDGRLNYQHPMPFQWQSVQDVTRSAKLLQQEEDLVPLVTALVRKLGEGSTGVLGRDVCEAPLSVSSQGLPRDMRSVFEPVIQNADSMQPTLDPAGYLLGKRGWRRDFSPWREPQVREIQPPMNRGPHLNKRRSLEVILP
jgi:hypothetical protein